MSDNRIKVFIGSSSSPDATQIVGLLTVALDRLTNETQAKTYKVSSWIDNFGVTQSIEGAFQSLLRENQFFVLILTPDAESRRLSGDKAKIVINENVLFEAGAAYGRHGIEKVILVQDPKVEIVSDLKGIMTIELDSATDNPETYIREVARRIDAHIRKVVKTDHDKKLRFLSLMKCKPSLQHDVVNWITNLEKMARDKWDVEYVRCGVLWGPPDDLLLFSVPSVENFDGFITALRTRLGNSIIKIDSRFVFPGKYWQQSTASPANMKCFHLVLLSCAPQFVEIAYAALVDAAKDERKRGITEVDIVTVGVTAGDADLFFITAAEREDLHKRFVEKHLHKDLLQLGWLTENTTSMEIT